MNTRMTPRRWPVLIPVVILLQGAMAGPLTAATPTATPKAMPTRAAQSDAMTVLTRPLTALFSAYGQVLPIAPLPISAMQPGVVTQVKVMPGARVRAGDALATLSGPEVQALLISREGEVGSARAQLAAAERTLAIERRQLSAQMSTQQSVAAAQSAEAAAQAALDTAQAQLHVAQEVATVRAPSAGTVLAVAAAPGQRVALGQTLITLQTANQLWLAATYYGADAAAIRVGMTGQFQPAGAGARVPVKVVAVSAALAPDAGVSVGLLAAPGARAAQAARAAAPGAPWMNGERGTVIIQGATQSLPVVPTRALILDQARWWVLVRTAGGVHAQAVIPGPARGWDTFIEQGLSPGQQVVVENAYLEYHRGIAQRYTPPD